MPGKRSAAGRYIRHGTRDFAGWRLRLTRPTGSSHRLTPRRPAQAQRRRAMASGTVPVILPGGGCALPGLQDPLTGSHPVGPRKRSAAGRDIRHDTRDVAGRRLAPYPAYGACDLSLIYSPFLLKLPVLTASKSLRRSRQAGAARMDAG